MSDIKQNLLNFREKLAEIEKRYHRSSGSVLLLAVSKNQSVEKISEAVASGQMAFGENYLQEALEKIAFFTEKSLDWHFIGPIQSNKTKKISEFFNWVHSVDNARIAKRLNDQRPLHLPPLNICLEVNISEEKTKSGVNIEDILPLAEYCLTLPRLKLRGLMTIPAQEKTIEAQRAQFHKLKILSESLQQKGFMLDTLSMGMSDDWEAAVAEGATIVRIGTRIFGKRI